MIKYLDNKICFVCCYFNHTDSKSRFYNFLKFLDSFKKHNITLIVVEGFMNDSKLRINEYWPNTISVKVKQKFWIKEMLINIGIKIALTNDIEKIGWIDCDIIVDSKNFKELIIGNKNRLFQIFGSAKQNITNKNYIYVDSCCKMGCMLGFEKSLLNRIGEVGYGYVYDTTLLRTNLLYEYAIVGTGDWLNLLGYIELENFKMLYNDRFFRGTTIEFFNSYIIWCMKNTKILESEIGFLDIQIEVLNHGNLEERRYVDRENLIKLHKFNPTRDLKSDRKIFNILNTKLLEDISNYFILRNDDKYFNKNTHIRTHKKIKTKEDTQKILVLSLHTDKKIKIETHSKVKTYRKQGVVRKGETVLLNNSSSHTHTFFNYIIENYENLPDSITLMTDNVGSFELEILRSDIQNKNKKYYMNICEKYKEQKSEYFFESVLNNLKK
jgi:hypothetical protein